ncbi:MAG TPA: serine protease [Chitinophagaceae bacterium]|nr:serine protease [Chitinophagaceae bacterium]
MNDPQLLEAIERYLRGEMNPEEQGHFEALRQSNPEVDQLVVEHKFFLEQLEQYGNIRDYKNTLHDVHTSLSEKGEIKAGKSPSKIVYLWNRYKRVAAIAACIAGLTAVVTNAVVWTVAPKAPSNAQIQQLDREIKDNKDKTNKLATRVDELKDATTTANTPEINYTKAGTGFLIDGKGLMITNAHTLQKSRNVSVVNTKGEKFHAIVLRLDVTRDIAIIKIDDDKFKPFASLPYGIRKNSSDLAETIFTLGFPRDEVVYGEGYLSAHTGFEGDTLSCQISITANKGNSGGPIFNKNGEVIGILTSKETELAGAVFAVQSKYIYNALEELKKNPLYKSTKLSTKSTLAGMDKVQQVKKLQDYVFMVKGDVYNGK